MNAIENFFFLETVMHLFILLENIEMPSLLVELAAKCTMRPDFYDPIICCIALIV